MYIYIYITNAFDEYVFSTIFFLAGKRTIISDGGETFLWQLEGVSKVTIDNREFRLIVDDILLIPFDSSYQINSSTEGITLSCKMSLRNQLRA